MTSRARDIGPQGKAKHPYPYIVAWGRRMGSMPYYISDQVALALESKAPRTAYAIKQEKSPVHGGLEDWDGKSWYTVDDLPPTVRTDLESMVRSMGQTP